MNRKNKTNNNRNNEFAKKLLIPMIVIAVFISFKTINATEYLLKGPSVVYNWSKGFIQVNASQKIFIDAAGNPHTDLNSPVTNLNTARLYAGNVACDSAREELINSLLELQIDPEHTMRELLESNAEFNADFNNLVAHRLTPQITPAKFNSVDAKIILKFSDLIQIIPTNYPSAYFPLPVIKKVKTDYTSLIIDARKIDVSPMLFPVVFDEGGLEVYGKRYVKSEFAVKRGLVTYCRNVNEAVGHPVAGNHPFYILALKSLKKSPVIANDDVYKIYSSNRTRDKLKECSVIFIIK